MKIGQEVLCVSDDFWYPPYPHVGDIDKIVDMKIDEGKLWLRLERFNYSMGYQGKIVGFAARNFVPLDQVFSEEESQIQLEEIKTL